MPARRTVQTAMAHSDGAELLVLSGREAPELKELTNLPDGMHLLDTGRPGQELKGASLQHMRTCVLHARTFATILHYTFQIVWYCIAQIGRSRIGRK